jgi:hypothetical protein
MKSEFKGYFGEKKHDDSGMRTAIWGPTGWIFLHCIAQNYPWRPSQEQQENYYNFFKLTGNVLPCRYCRESYQQFCNEPGTLLSMDTMKNRKSLVTWLYRIHNKVNKKLEVKSHPTLREVWDKYESFRSVCHKTPKKIKKKGCTVPLNGIRKRCVINFVDEPRLKFGKKVKIIKNFSDQEINGAMSVLGVTDNREIRKKYSELVKVYDPDKPGGDLEKMKQVNSAMDILRSAGLTRFGKIKKKSIKLISIKRSSKSGKKLMATFETNGRKKVIHFGAAGMSDYTRHHDKVRRNRYIFRHLKDYRTGDPSRAGYLSMFVLWNKPSLQASIADYRRRLGVYNRTGKFPTNIPGYSR